MLKGCYSTWCGIETDVLGVGGKMHQVAVQSEGWHTVADGLTGIRCSNPDGVPHLLQLMSDMLGKGCDVGIHIAVNRPLIIHFLLTIH